MNPLFLLFYSFVSVPFSALVVVKVMKASSFKDLTGRCHRLNSFLNTTFERKWYSYHTLECVRDWSRSCPGKILRWYLKWHYVAHYQVGVTSSGQHPTSLHRQSFDDVPDIVYQLAHVPFIYLLHANNGIIWTCHELFLPSEQFHIVSPFLTISSCVTTNFPQDLINCHSAALYINSNK